MIFGTIIPVLPAMTVSAADADQEKQSRIAEVKEVLGAVPYIEYLKKQSGIYFEKHGDYPWGSKDKPVVIAIDRYLSDPELTTATGITVSDISGKTPIYAPEKGAAASKKAIYLPDKGTVSFPFTVEKEGLYNLEFTYIQKEGKTSAIERLIKIDGKVPFREARYITLAKTYADDYVLGEDGEPTFLMDIKNNEIRPPKIEAPEWKTVLTEDSSGFVEEPFLYYLEAGEHVLTLEAVRESVYMSDIRFVVAPKIPTYEDYRKSHPDVKGTAEIKDIQAQKPTGTSEITIYPLNDRTSSITYPQDASRIRLNSIGSNKWQIPGQWIKYEFEVPAGGAGFYYIVPRFKQAVYSGVYSSRKIRIDGEIPFREANRLRFNFDDSWQVLPLNDGTVLISGNIKVGGSTIPVVDNIAAVNGKEYSVTDGVKVDDRYYPVIDGTVTIGGLKYNIINRKLTKDKREYPVDSKVIATDSGDVYPVQNIKKAVENFEFYLTEGKHVLELEVSLGDMSELLGRVEVSVMRLNEMYRKIRMITGASPDAYRDYGFARQIPAVLEGMWEEAQNLRDISALFESIIGAKGEHTVMLEKMALQLDRMAHNTDRIAPGLDTFKANIGGMSTWLLERRNQPLEIDYIKIMPVDQKLPQAEANFFQAVAFEFSSFIMSFFSDYNSQGMMQDLGKDAQVVEVWMGSAGAAVGGLSLAGRDQAQIARQMVVDFTRQTNIQVNLKLVAGGSLLPSVLAGVGPDIALSNGGGDAINFAIRSAVLPLNYSRNKETGELTQVEYSKGDPSRSIKSFDEVVQYFTPSALTPLTLQNSAVEDKSKLQVFGLPETQTFSMLFYRKDILVDLDLEIPTTWDDLFDIVPDLQTKNLDVGIGPGMGPLTIFMFQQNVDLYKGDGIEINLDDNMALDAFRRMTRLYTEYKFPVTFDFANRFRMGDMPISVQGYDAYNQLMVFAPEIRGLWEFVPMPGTIREKTPQDEGMGYAELEGGLIIDNTTPAGVTCTLMMKSSLTRNNAHNAWAFMQWWVGAETQGRFGSELVAMMGAAAKYPTANLEALGNMPWPAADYENLMSQFRHLEAVPQVPGGYIVDRYVDFAWKAVYNEGKSAVEELQDVLVEINKELTRKRGEFDMPVIPRDRFGRRLDRNED